MASYDYEGTVYISQSELEYMAEDLLKNFESECIDWDEIKSDAYAYFEDNYMDIEDYFLVIDQIFDDVWEIAKEKYEEGIDE